MIRSKRKPLRRFVRVKANEPGFTLPLSIGVGISMLLVGSLMIARSHVDQTSAFAQVGAVGALGVAEAGVARTMSLLNSPDNAHLLTRNFEQDRGDGKEYLGSDQILRSGDESTTLINEWDDPTGGCSTPSATDFAALTTGTVGTGSNQGTYRVLAYRFNPLTQVGSLLVEGRFRGSASRVQVAFNLRTRNSAGSNGFPGLYASQNIRLGTNGVLRVTGETGVSANVICRDCTVSATPTNCDAVTGQPTADGLKLAFDRNNLSTIDGRSLIAPVNLPPVPTPPASGSTGRYEITSDITSSMTFPRAGETPDANGVFHYIIPNITLGGSDNITINSAVGRVRFYVSGNVSLTGSGGFVHTGSPDRFAIFGTGGTSQTIELSGGATTSSLFVYAPNATANIKDGSAYPDIQGAVWVREWDGSGSTNAEIQVPDNMPALLSAAFGNAFVLARSNSTTAPTSWSREGTVR